MKRPSRCLLLPPVATACIMALFLAPSIVMAVAPQEAIPGDRVRVRYAPGPGSTSNTGAPERVTVGRFLRASGDSVAVEMDSGAHAMIPASSIAHVERLSGTKGHTLTGAIIGGALGGVVLLAAPEEADEPGSPIHDDGLEVAVSVMVVALGISLGGLVGSLVKSDQWEPAAFPGLNVGVTNTGERTVGVAVTIPF